MKNFEISDVKKFMNELLNGTRFDSFYMHETRLKVAVDYYISGEINQKFFESDGEDGEEKNSEIPKYIYWRDIKHVVFELMKGKRLPVNFKIILKFNCDNIRKLIEMNNLALSPDDVGALFYNISFDDGKLQVVTGSSIKVFSLDKSLDNIWDDTVQKYYLPE
jgi:hypothetical protein